MNVLFVCAYNVGRSQMAAALFNKHAQNGHADSAGTIVGDDHGQTITERAQNVGGAKNVISVMDEEGIDVREKTRTQIDEAMLSNYAKVIVMAEQDTIPDYLRSSDKFVYWHIEDPRTKDLDGVRAAKDDIKAKILEFIRDNKA